VEKRSSPPAGQEKEKVEREEKLMEDLEREMIALMLSPTRKRRGARIPLET